MRRGRPTQAEAKKLDMAVREGHLKTFVEMSYAGAGMEAVAKAAGITRRSLYTRCADKRALFAGVIPWVLACSVEEESVTDCERDGRPRGAECLVRAHISGQRYAVPSFRS
jgi:TetR/AcrR family transcriptional regulator, mexJK operon transcriptional repressor